MGNQLAQPQRLQPEHLAELPNVVLKDTLGGGRFLKTLLCVHDEGGLVVVKVYYKRGDVPGLDEQERRLADIRQRLWGLPCPHVWPFQSFYQTDKACYLLRQHLYANLHTRLTSRPFLRLTEKRWIAFQLLEGLAQSHAAGVCHGDIKSENVLITSWNWVYLTDLASYKPTRLPADNPADFSYFFDTGGRRRCYIAPERLYESNTPEAAASRDALLEPAMDVFSLGCVLAELFHDGKELFDLSKLIAYRRGELALEPLLADVDPSVQHLILGMTRLKPEERPSAADCLQGTYAAAFPVSFQAHMHPFFSSLLPLGAEARLAAVQTSFPALAACLDTSPGFSGREGCGALPQASADAHAHTARSLPPGGLTQEAQSLAAAAGAFQQRLQDRSEAALQLAGAQSARGNNNGHKQDQPAQASRWQPLLAKDVFVEQQVKAAGSDWASTGFQHPSKQKEEVDKSERGRDGEGWTYPVRRGVEGPQQQGPEELRRRAEERRRAISLQRRVWVRHRTHSQPSAGSGDGGEGMILIAALLCVLVRGLKLQHSKERAIALLTAATMHCDDEDRLQRVVPYLLSMVSDGLASVRCTALRCLAKVLSAVENLVPSDAKVFTEYILPSVSLVPNDAEESVRVEFTGVVAQLAATAYRFLQQLQCLHAPHMQPSSASTAPALTQYREEVSILRLAVERVLAELLLGPHSTPATRLALLPHVSVVAEFLGRKESRDFLLPAVIAFLNDRAWPLRAALFQHMPSLIACTGKEALEAYLLPCLEQALADPEEAVIGEALAFLASVTEKGLLQRRSIIAVAAKVAPHLLVNASPAIRFQAVSFLAAAAAAVSPADRFSLLLPLVKPAFKAEPLSLTSPQNITDALNLAVNESFLTHRPSKGASGGPPHSGTFLAHSGALPTHALLQRGAAVGSGSPLQPGRSRVGKSSRQSSLRDGGGSQGGMSARQRLGTAISDSPQPRAQRRSGGSGSITPGARGSGQYGAEPAAEELQLQPNAAPLYRCSIPREALQPNASHLAAAMDAVPPSRREAPGNAGEAECSDTAIPSSHQAETSASLTGLGHPLLRNAVRLAPMTHAGPNASQQRLGMAASWDTRGVSDAMAAALASDLPAHSSPSSASVRSTASGGTADASAPSWQPRGILIAHLAEHRRGVTELAVAAHRTFFASASLDETVKIWDCRRLEQDVAFASRLTYTAQGGHILTCTACEEGQSIASGSSNGSIHVWRVETSGRSNNAPERYVGFTGKQELNPGEGPVLRVREWGGLLLLSTQRGGMHAWDLRAGKNAWRIPCPSNQGVLARWASDPIGPNWLLTGSTRGRLGLWDARFLVPVRSWTHPSGLPINCLEPTLAPAAHLGLSANSAPASCPLVWVAAGGGHEVGLWDLEEGHCHQVLRAFGPSSTEAERRESPAALQRKAQPASGAANPLDQTSLERHLLLPSLEAPQPKTAGVRALLATSSGSLLSAGTDQAIHHWQPARHDHSYLVCAPPSTKIQATDSPSTDQIQIRAMYTKRVLQNVAIVEEAILPQQPSIAPSSSQATSASGSFTGSEHMQTMPPSQTKQASLARQAALCHQDAILGLALLDGISDRLLLSCGREGVIKAWR
ncbi:hypothetical protein WJX84_011949 [Apatococcus fuscideae]|uniref:non-specific serine/threonine protein kinase n=1 Tax=Apatococcus fuscideae TaxID=2026836 RepID=A0AAW1T346_9CHLO